MRTIGGSDCESNFGEAVMTSLQYNCKCRLTGFQKENIMKIKFAVPFELLMIHMYCKNKYVSLTHHLY